MKNATAAAIVFLGALLAPSQAFAAAQTDPVWSAAQVMRSLNIESNIYKNGSTYKIFADDYVAYENDTTEIDQFKIEIDDCLLKKHYRGRSFKIERNEKSGTFLHYPDPYTTIEDSVKIIDLRDTSVELMDAGEYDYWTWMRSVYGGDYDRHVNSKAIIIKCAFSKKCVAGIEKNNGRITNISDTELWFSVEAVADRSMSELNSVWSGLRQIVARCGV